MIRKIIRNILGKGPVQPTVQQALAVLPLQPVSTAFGYDRGGPVDRYYIESFLGSQETHIRGRVLEVGDNAYTLQFGGERVTQSDILHLDATHPQATITGDLTDLREQPDHVFDTIILTQTLQLIYDVPAALRTCHRILRPGGSLLLTVPGISPIAHDQWGSYWQWFFTSAAIQRAVTEAFPGGELQLKVYGNVKAATAFLYGFGQPELSSAELDYLDTHYPVIIAALVQKKSAS